MFVNEQYSSSIAQAEELLFTWAKCEAAEIFDTALTIGLETRLDTVCRARMMWSSCFSRGRRDRSLSRYSIVSSTTEKRTSKNFDKTNKVPKALDWNFQKAGDRLYVVFDYTDKVPKALDWNFQEAGDRLYVVFDYTDRVNDVLVGKKDKHQALAMKNKHSKRIERWTCKIHKTIIIFHEKERISGSIFFPKETHLALK